MKPAVSTSVRLMFVLLALLFAVGTMNAQTVKGSFTLPYSAYWGNVAMSPGQYSFDLDVQGRVPIILHLGQTTKLSRFGFSESLHSPAKSELVMVQAGDKWVVNGVYVASIHKAFWFKVPEKYSVSHRVIADSGSNGRLQFIPLTINGE